MKSEGLCSGNYLHSVFNVLQYGYLITDESVEWIWIAVSAFDTGFITVELNCIKDTDFPKANVICLEQKLVLRLRPIMVILLIEVCTWRMKWHTFIHSVCQPGNSNPLKERGSDWEGNKWPWHTEYTVHIWAQCHLKPNTAVFHSKTFSCVLCMNMIYVLTT